MRYVVVHFHLFKNAGTSVDTVLEQCFGDRFGSVEGPTPDSTLYPRELWKFIAENPKYQYLTSHQATPPIPLDRTFTIIPLFFIRHPLDRIESIYLWHKRHAEENGLTETMAQVKSLKEYVTWHVHEYEGHLITNFHIDRLSGIRAFHTAGVILNPDAYDYEQTVQLLKTIPFGIVEQFDKSCELISAYLQQYFPDANLQPMRENASTKRKSTLEERLAHLKEQLGGTLYDEVVAANRYDLKLYAYALKIHNERVLALKQTNHAGTPAALPCGVQNMTPDPEGSGLPAEELP